MVGVTKSYEGAHKFEGVVAEKLYLIDSVGAATELTATIDDLNNLSGNRMLVANKTGGNLTKGMLVYISGYDTTLTAPKVAKSDADANLPAQYVVNATIANNESGYVYGIVTVTGLDTQLAAAVGSVAYLDTTAGGWTFTAPSGAGEMIQKVGVCVLKDATAGSIRFFPGEAWMNKVGTSELEDKAVTNAKIADESKLGLVGDLSTSTKTNLVAAINEVDGHADAAYVKPGGGIPSTDMTTAVSNALTAAGTAYQKPGGGIPSADMASAVGTSLGKADSAYQKPGGGIPNTDMTAAVQASLTKADSALVGHTGFTYIRAKKALQLNAHGTSPVKFVAADAAVLTGGAGPYDMSGVGNGGTIKLGVDEIAEATATFNATAGYHTGGLNPSVDISGGADTSFKIQVDGDATPRLITLVVGALNSGAAIATAIQAAIQALGGVYAAVTCSYEHAPVVDHYLITSHDLGTGSAVAITRADANNLTEELKLGPDGGTSTAGTGDAVSIHSVTRGEVATLIAGDIATVDASGASALVVTSKTTGKDSRLLAGNGTLNTIIGIPNTTVDNGAQGLGFATAMSDANYIVLATLSDVADPTNHGVSVNNRAAAGFDLVSDGATDADYVDLLVVGVPA